jgi:hypothetical protein
MLHADLRAPMLANIYVAGGCSLLKNYAERLQHEVRALAPEYAQVNVKVSQAPAAAADRIPAARRSDALGTRRGSARARAGGKRVGGAPQIR